MDIDKVRGLSDAELDAALKDAKQDLWQARFALSTRQLKDYSQVPQARRTIHIPYCGGGLDAQLLFNPGSPTERRAQPHHTYGVLHLREGAIVSAQIIEI